MGVLDTRFEGALSLLTRFFFFPATIEGTLPLVEAPDTLALEVFEMLEFCVDACLEALVDVQGLLAIFFPFGSCFGFERESSYRTSLHVET